MKKIYCLMGKSASGKDTLYKKLLKEIPYLYGYVSYTTREKRDNEKDGVEYNFINLKEFRKIKEKDIIECRYYDADNLGRLYYATINDEQFKDNDNILLIGTLDSYLSISSKFDKDTVIPIYIETDDKTRLLRSLNRNNNVNCHEVCRRFLSDEIEFSNTTLETLKIKKYRNDNLDACVEEIKKDLFS